MKISRTWLQKYFAEPLPPIEALAEALTFHVFEVEDVEGDVMDVKVLPDRAAYGLSHRGVALELSAALGVPLKEDPLRQPLPAWPQTDELAISIDTAKSARQMGALVRGVTVGPSPAWLKEALESVGQRSVNNVVDATNYVTLDMGQPLHAFDAAKVGKAGGKVSIRVRDAEAGETITVLSGEEYALPAGAVVIAEGHSGRALDIAGIKGGQASAITEDTTELYVSVANFDAKTIRKTAQALKLWTDASQRFQNDLSPELAAYGMRDILALITEIAGGEVVGVVDVRAEASVVPAPVSVSLARIRSVLGAPFTEEEVSAAFTRLGLAYTLADDTYTVLPSFERRDLVIPEDLIEEVGRTIGYDQVPSLPLPSPATVPDQVRYRGLERIRDFFTERGYTEVSTQSFASAGAVKLANPLQQDRPYLRASLLANLEDALTRATTDAPRTVGPEQFLKLFELGTVFTEDGEFILIALGINALTGKQARAADALKEHVATFEQELLREPSAARYSLAGDRVEINLTALDLEALGAIDGVPYEPVTLTLGAFRPYSPYPFALRDIAVWTPEGTEVSEVENAILKEAGDLVARIDLFDRFEKDGRTSYAFRMVFESMERTLADTDLDPLMARITDALNARAGWEVR